MKLTDEEMAELARIAPELHAKLTAVPEEEPEDPIIFEDQPIAPIVTESGEARDFDTVQPADVCPACERGAPRPGAPHTCGLPNPYFEARPTWQ